jgi:predicted membrane channel-forming protein YqfA (hemolysin III family)
MFGIFEGIRSFAVIIGYILTFCVFKYYDGFTFFSILIPIGLASVGIFLILPMPNNI